MIDNEIDSKESTGKLSEAKLELNEMLRVIQY